MVSKASRPPSRIRLYLPFALLGLVIAAWSAGWFVIRARVLDETAAWRARELAQGRTWTCPNERVGGFPFRIELRCDTPTLSWGPADARITATVGSLTMVTQVYQLRRAIIEAAGPFALRLPDGDAIDGTWTSLRASLSGSADEVDRVSVVWDRPAWTLTRPDGVRETASAQMIEFQGRPDPQRFDTEGTVDGALTISRAALPLVDALTGDGEPADLSVVATVSRAPALIARDPVEAAEAWRAQGGTLTLAPLKISKGGRMLEARGEIAIDALRRPEGQLDLAARGLDSLIGRLTGGSQRATALVLGGLSILGGRPAQAPSTAQDPGLKPLPSLGMRNGRLLLGPFPVAEIGPLY